MGSRRLDRGHGAGRGAPAKVGLMVASQPHLLRLPKPDERWVPRPYPREELLDALIEGGMAGVVTHPMDNVLWKIGLLCDGDAGSQFGLSGVDVLGEAEVLRIVAEASG